MADNYTPRMRKRYDDVIVKAMTEKFGYKNAMEVPKIEKIVLNMGVGEATQDKKKVESAAAEMELIAGQKPVVTKAKKSIAQFKLREGMPIGARISGSPIIRTANHRTGWDRFFRKNSAFPTRPRKPPVLRRTATRPGKKAGLRHSKRSRLLQSTSF